MKLSKGGFAVLTRSYLLERSSINKLNLAKMKKQLRQVKKDVDANSALGVTSKIKGRLTPKINTGEGGKQNYCYSVQLIASADGDRAEEALDLIERIASKNAALQKWNLVGETDAVQAARNDSKARPPFMLRGMTDEIIRSEFADIINRDAHLRTVHRSTEMFVKSGGKMRSHTIMYGEPGAAKTSMFLRLKDFYEKDSDVERVKVLDSTTLSKAGLENWILDRADDGTLPEIILFEEIEKYDMNVLLPLGSVMDGRGVLTKVNARVNRRANTNMLVWMTCNDEDFVKRWHRGFLWSRCANKIECVRPSRQEMEDLILPRKVEDIGGNLQWIKPACDFAYSVLKTDDPREVMSCLDGQDALLDGTYQADRLKIIELVNLKKKRTPEAKRDEFS
jgi:hypothetical protein